MRRLALAALCALLVPATCAQAAEIPEIPIASATLHALDGMAPAGHWAARVTALRNSYTRRYDNSGRRVDLDAAYDGLDLARVGLAGTLRLDTQVITEYTELMFGYGVTEDLTVGAIIPWATTHTRARVAVDGGVGTAGLQTALAAGLGYRPLASTSAGGLGDPTFGLLWRFHKSARDSALFGFGVRVGMAPPDDPNNLLDVPPGDGSTDLRLRLEYFRDLGRGFDLRLLAEHQIQFADEVTLRPGNPLTSPRSERLRRDLGDYQEFDIELGKSIGDWRLSATWHRYQEAADRYTSKIGSDTSFLNANTETRADQYRIGLTWSGVRAWQAGRLPLPLIVKLEMQDAFRGRNFVDVRDIYLRVTSLF